MDPNNQTSQQQMNQIPEVENSLNQEPTNQTSEKQPNQTSEKQPKIINCKATRRLKTKNPSVSSKHKKVSACQNLSLSATVALSNLGDDDIDYLFSKDDSKLDEEFQLCVHKITELNDMFDGSKDDNNDENYHPIDYSEEIAEIGISLDPKLISRSILNHKR